MQKQFVILATLLISICAHSGEKASILDGWMNELRGEYSMKGSAGCASFKIVKQSSLTDFFYYVDFGSLRNPQEALLFITGSRVQLTINSISESELSVTASVPSNSFWGVSDQNISFKIQKNQERKLQSLSIYSQQGLNFNVINCD